MGDLITSTRAARTVSAALLGIVLSLVWTWWALRQGAYFGSVLYPGTLLLCGTLVVLAIGAPWRVSLRLSRPLVIGVACLFGLAAWTMISALWSPAPEEAIFDGQRVMLYGVVVVLGIWLCNLLSGYMQLSLAPLALAGLLTALATISLTMGTEDAARFLEPDGTLDWPLGYRNANAAFFLIAMWAALGLAQLRHIHWLLRAIATGTAGLCLGVAVICQSRGSVVAAAIALIVYVALSPERARALLFLALAAAPAALVVGPASELYTAANQAGLDDTGTAAALNRAAQVALGAAIFSGLVGAVVSYLDRQHRPASDRLRTSNRLTLVAFCLAVVAALALGAASTGDPVGWAGDRFDELESIEQPEYAGEDNRYVLNLQTPRPDLWEVAVRTGTGNPALGAGAGGYRFEYTRERETDQSTVHDAHNVFLEAFSELGLPGLLLLIGTLGGLIWAAMRARSLGPSAAGLTAIAITIVAYWLVHSSLDWFWPYPVITAPVLALLGAAAAPRVLVPADLDLPSRSRRIVAVVAVLLAVSVLAPFISDRYLGHARNVWPSDFDRAMDDVERAKSFNPLSIQPYLTEGAIAREAGEEERAIAAFGEATAKRPESWEAWYQLGITSNSREDLLRAQELNPLGSEIEEALQSAE